MKETFTAIFVFISVTQIFSQNFWQNIGGPPGGKVQTIAFDSSGNIFAGASNGAYVSANNGENWLSINNGLSNKNIYALAVSSSGNIFAATQGGGIFRSTDTGNSWIQINSGLTNYYSNALIILSNGNILTGTQGGLFQSSDNGDNWTMLIPTIIISFTISQNGNIFAGSSLTGIFVSTDDGYTWLQKNNGIDPNVYGQIDVPSLACNSNGEIFSGTRNGPGKVYRSTNNGDTWSNINNGLSYPNILSLAVNSNNYLFAGTEGGGIFRSTNNGGFWTSINSGFLHIGSVNSLVASHNNTIYTGIGGYGIYRSNNDGDNWEEINTGLCNPVGLEALVVNSAGHILIGTHGQGFFRTTNKGQTWFEINNGISPSWYYAQSLAIGNNEHIFAGTTDGLWRSTNNGDSWVRILYEDISLILINPNGYIFAGLGYNGIYRSSNNGANWTLLTNGLPRTTIHSLILSLNGYIFAGTEFGIFVSSNNGDSWIERNNGITNTWIRSLVISKAGYIFAGSAGGIFISSDDGDSWIERNNGLTNIDLYSLTINSNDYIFAGTWGSGVYMSTDYGNSWIQLNSGLYNSDIYYNCLILDSNGYIFAGTWGNGVFTSKRSTFPIEIIAPNGGEVWEYNSLQEIKWNNYNNEIDSIKIEYSTDSCLTWNTIISSTPADSGSYNWLVPSINSPFCRIRVSDKIDSTRLDISDEFFTLQSIVSVEELINHPFSFELSQNYPNPFNPSTKISWQSPVSGWQTLKVYDVLGNEVATLVDEHKPAGNYEVEFNPASSIKNLASGIYFYQLKVGNFIQSRKMVLLK